MKLDNKSLLLYAVTDRSWVGDSSLAKQVEDAAAGGITILQLREKELSEEEFLKQAVLIKEITGRYNIPFIINDNIEVAVKSGADGVHVGQKDMCAKDVRALIGKDKILGVSVSTVEEAVLAYQNGADYLGVGAVFTTQTKADAKAVSFETLKKITKSVPIPVVAIGGITENNIKELSGSGICGVAVVSAIFAKEDIKAATKALKKITEDVFG